MVCLLRLAPQEIEFSARVTRGMVMLSVLADALHVFVIGLESAFPRVLVSLCFLLAVPWITLSVFRRQARFAQTLAALAGTGVLFALLFIPVSALAQAVGPVLSPDQLTAPQITLGWLLIGLSAWRLMVVAHILRHALDTRLFAASLLTIGWFVLEVALSNWLFASAQ